MIFSSLLFSSFSSFRLFWIECSYFLNNEKKRHKKTKKESLLKTKKLEFLSLYKKKGQKRLTKLWTCGFKRQRLWKWRSTQRNIILKIEVWEGTKGIHVVFTKVEIRIHRWFRWSQASNGLHRSWVFFFFKIVKLHCCFISSVFFFSISLRHLKVTVLS